MKKLKEEETCDNDFKELLRESKSSLARKRNSCKTTFKGLKIIRNSDRILKEEEQEKADFLNGKYSLL